MLSLARVPLTVHPFCIAFPTSVEPKIILSAPAPALAPNSFIRNLEDDLFLTFNRIEIGAIHTNFSSNHDFFL